MRYAAADQARLARAAQAKVRNSLRIETEHRVANLDWFANPSIDYSSKYLRMAVPAKLELATFGLGNRCSIRLSYGTKLLEDNDNRLLAESVKGTLLPKLLPESLMAYFRRPFWCSAKPGQAAWPPRSASFR